MSQIAHKIMKVVTFGTPNVYRWSAAHPKDKDRTRANFIHAWGEGRMESGLGFACEQIERVRQSV